MGSHVTAACKRHLDDLKRKEISFDVDEADRVFRFFEGILKLNGGQFEGKPFLLHESQAFILGSVYGWKRKDGKRRFRRVYIEEAKGNGKSPMAAGVGLYGMVADNEARAEIYPFASKFDQAKVLYRDARAMVQLSPALNGILQIHGGDHQPNISFPDKGSFFRPLSSDKGQSGPRPHYGLGDEIHEHASGELLEMIERGFKFREQPILWMFTNSGFDKNTVCWEEHDHAVKVVHGDIDDDTTFGFVCGLDDGDDPLEDEGCWIKANPLLGTIISKDYLRDVVKQAKSMPGKRNNILRLHFCVWTDAESVWLPREVWEACEVKTLEINPELPCYGALDLTYRRDLNADAWVWKHPDKTYDAIVNFFTPQDTLKDHEDKDRVPYRQWVREGHVRTTPGSTVDYKHVVPVLGEMNGKYDLQKLGYDRWRIELLKIALDDAGIDLNRKMEPFGQGFKDMAPAIDAVEAAIMNGRIRVLFNPCLRWNVASTVIISDPAGGRKFAKNKSTGRIDGVVALTMAVAIAERSEQVDISAFLNDPIKGKW